MSPEKSVRPEIPANIYRVWRKTAKDLGYGNSGRGLWRLIRFLMEFAAENPSFFRTR